MNKVLVSVDKLWITRLVIHRKRVFECFIVDNLLNSVDKVGNECGLLLVSHCEFLEVVPELGFG